MGKAHRLHRIIRVNGSRVLAVKIILSLAAVAFAASVNVTSSTYQAEIGSTVIVANNLIALDRGFGFSTTAWTPVGATCPSSPVTFAASPGSANTTITPGHWVFDVRVNSTSSAIGSKVSNVTLALAGQTYGPLCVQTPGTPSDNQMIDCRFDVGNVLPASPYSFKITIQ